MVSGRPKILLAVTGSVAAVKLPLLCKHLGLLGELKIVTTKTAKHFIDLQQLPQSCTLLEDADEWSSGWGIGDPVLHIELRRWADVLVIAPLSANSLAKLSTGMCDNLLTCIARAWDYSLAPLVVAPAMNTLMWDSPLTRTHLHALLRLGAVVVPPVAKRLACGDVGVGAMASPEAIAQVVRAVLQNGRFGRLPANAQRWAHIWPAWLKQGLLLGLAASVGLLGGLVLHHARGETGASRRLKGYDVKG